MKPFSITRIASLLIAGLLIAPGGNHRVFAQDAESNDSAAEEVTQVTPLQDTDPVISIDGQEITLQNLKVLVSNRPSETIRIDPSRELPILRGDALKELAQWVAAFGVVAKEAEEKGVSLTDEQKARVERDTDQVANSQLYKKVVTEKIEEPTEEQLKEQYEADKETSYKIDEELKLRHIYVSTYEPYTVKTGDTLESIAKEVNGDESIAEKILSDETKKPRMEVLEETATDESAETSDSDDEKETLAPRALVEGEVLLVPLSDERAQEVKDRIDEAWQALEDGKTFEEVSMEYSENPNPGRVFSVYPTRQDRPMLETLSEAFMELEDGEYSKPVRTRHGSQIVGRDSYRPEGYRTFEEVKGRLESSFKNNQVQGLVADFFKESVNDPDITLVNVDNLKLPVEEAKADDVLVTIGDKDFTRGDIAKATRDKSAEEKYRDEDEFRDLLTSIRQVQGELVSAKMEKLNLMEAPEVQMVEKFITETYLANNYLSERLEEEVKEVPDSEIEEFYNENQETFQRQESYEIYQVRVPLETNEEGEPANQDELLAEANEVFAGIANLKDFQDAALRFGKAKEGNTSAVETAMRKRTSDLTGDEKEAIEASNIPGVTEAFVFGNSIVVYWVGEKIEEGVAPLEEVKEQISQRLLREKRADRREEIIRSYMDKTDVEVLVD